jgi:hypothetical protein
MYATNVLTKKSSYPLPPHTSTNENQHQQQQQQQQRFSSSVGDEKLLLVNHYMMFKPPHVKESCIQGIVDYKKARCDARRALGISDSVFVLACFNQVNISYYILLHACMHISIHLFSSFSPLFLMCGHICALYTHVSGKEDRVFAIHMLDEYS